MKPARFERASTAEAGDGTSPRCYLCGRFISKDQEECPACQERMAGSQGEYFDGPRFNDWLDENGITYVTIVDRLNANIERYRTEWRGGAAIPLELMDKVLTGLGFHLSDLPPDLRRHSPPTANYHYPEKLHEEAVRLGHEGVRPFDVWQRFQKRNLEHCPTTKTIAWWMRKAGISSKKRYGTVWDGIEKRGPNECWPWKGKLGGRHRHLPQWKTRYVHRVILEEMTGGKCPETAIQRSCGDNRCCNPSHFEIKKQGSWGKFVIWGTQGR